MFLVVYRGTPYSELEILWTIVSIVFNLCYLKAIISQGESFFLPPQLRRRTSSPSLQRYQPSASASGPTDELGCSSAPPGLCFQQAKPFSIGETHLKAMARGYTFQWNTLRTPKQPVLCDTSQAVLLLSRYSLANWISCLKISQVFLELGILF